MRYSRSQPDAKPRAIQIRLKPNEYALLVRLIGKQEFPLKPGTMCKQLVIRALEARLRVPA